MVRYEAVNGRSKLTLEAQSSLHPIHTSVNQLGGFFEAKLGEDGRLDLSVAPNGRLEVEVESLKSGNALVDRAMQGRLDTRRFPLIKVELAELHETDEKGRYRAAGDVSFHGVTQRMVDELNISQLDDRTIEISGDTTLDVRDFKVEPPRLLMLKMEPEVKIMLKLVAERVD